MNIFPKTLLLSTLMLIGLPVGSVRTKAQSQSLPAAKETVRSDGSAIVAHRGYWNCEKGGFSPNSLASLRSAQEAGFWGSEFDINMTADGEILVVHDSSIDGKKIDQNPYSSFQDVRLKNGEPIPTLDQYLDQAAKYPTVLVLEVKWHSSWELETKAIRRTMEKLKAHGLFDPARVIFISFSLSACRTLVAEAPGFTVQYLGNDRNPDAIAEYGINGIDTWYKTLLEDPAWYAKARNHGMSINAWTVDGEEDMERLFRMGVDQLTTDRPDRARQLLERIGIPEIKPQKAEN